MCRFAVTFLFVLAASLSAFAQQPCKEYGPVRSILSFCPPAGMVSDTKPGQEHAAFFKGSPETKNFAVLTAVETQINAPLGEFGYEMIANTYTDQTKFKNSVLVGIGDLPAMNGVRGLRLAFHSDADRKDGTGKDRISQIYYIYDGPKGMKVTFAAILLASDTATESLIDTAMKTVRIKK